MLYLVFVVALTLALNCAIFIAALFALRQLQVNIVLPTVKLQIEPANQVEVDPKLTGESIPEHVLEYIEQESEPWARDSRRLRLRELRAELGSWNAAFAAIQLEDTPRDQ